MEKNIVESKNTWVRVDTSSQNCIYMFHNWIYYSIYTYIYKSRKRFIRGKTVQIDLLEDAEAEFCRIGSRLCFRICMLAGVTTV